MNCENCNYCKLGLLQVPSCELQLLHPYGGAVAVAVIRSRRAKELQK
jgi:hypothetical protein